MSFAAPDDPITNKPAAPPVRSKDHPSTVADYIAVVYVALQATYTELYTGTFDSVYMVDGAGTQHVVEARYDVGNNNFVYVEHRRQFSDGNMLKSRYYLGGTSSITDPNYVKIDGVGVAVDGRDLLLQMKGHRIADTPDNHVRKMGQVGATARLPGVWAPVHASRVTLPVPAPDQQSFSDVPKENTFWREAEIAHMTGMVSGHDNGTFAVADHSDKLHTTAEIVRALEWLADQSGA